MMTRRSIHTAIVGALALVSAAAHAQSYPARPVKLIVPYAAGGPTDTFARALADAWGKKLGQVLVVENRTGAGTLVGTDAVAKAQPDGYTILLTTVAHAVNPSIHDKMPYRTVEDFAPVGMAAKAPLVIVVNKNFPAQNLQEFIGYIKDHPGKVNYGSAGVGSAPHLGAELLNYMTGSKTEHVPYRGSAPADVDLAAGQIQFMTDTINSVMSFVKDKRMKLLAVTTAKRMSLFPDVPTLAETIMPGFEAGAWQGVMVPAGTPEPVVQRLNAEINKALQNPGLREKLAVQGAEPLGSSVQEYGAYLRKELARWASVVKATGITLD